jgi:hypothetical protein
MMEKGWNLSLVRIRIQHWMKLECLENFPITSITIRYDLRTQDSYSRLSSAIAGIHISKNKWVRTHNFT